MCESLSHKNSVTVAKQEMANLDFLPGETVAHFINRFERIAQRATASSDGVEDLVKPATVLTYLNQKFDNPGVNGPAWFLPFWKI